MSFFQSAPSYGAPQTSQAPDFQPYQRGIMPAPQPEQPGLLSLLAQSAGSGLGQGVASGIQQQMKNTMLEKALSKVKPNMSALEKARILGGAGPEAEPYINSIFQQEAAQNKLKQEQDFEREKWKEAHQNKIAEIGAKPIKPNQAEVKQQQKEKEAEQSFAKAQQAFDETAKLLGKGNLGNSVTTGGKLNRERQKDIGKMNFVRQNFEGLFRTMVNTGRITDKQYESLMAALPDPYASDMDNLGRLEGIGVMTGLDMSSLQGLFEKRPGSPKFIKGRKEKTEQSGRPAELVPVPPGFVRMIDPTTGVPRDIMESKAAAAQAAGWINE